MNRALYIGIFLAAVCLSTWTVKGQYRIDSWTTENGLPQNSISGLIQTPDGYIWVGTSDGLVRFDGVRFTVFNKANSPNFPNNRLGYLKADRSGRIWVTTEDGVLFYYQNGAFTIVKPKNDPVFGESGGMQDDGEGSVLVWSNAQSRTFRYRDGKLAPLEIAGLPVNAQPLGADRERTLWFFRDNRVYRVRSGQVTTLTLPVPGRQAITYITTDRSGNTWIARDFDEKIIYRYRHGVISSVPLPMGRIWSVTEDRFGNIWFASYDQGVARLDAAKANTDEPQPGDFQYFSLAHGAAGLPSDHCVIILADPEGGVWTGTEKGLARFTPQVVRMFSKADGMPEDNVYPILEDRTGAIWLGAWQNSLMKFAGGKFSTELMDSNYAFYSSLYEDPSGGIWFGNLHGFYQFKDRKPVERTAELGFPAGVLVNVVITDRAGRRWAGLGQGLSRTVNGQNSVFTVKDGVPDDFVDALLAARDGRLWVGTRGGVAVIANPGAPSPVFTRYTEAEGLAGNHTRSLYEDADGVVWIGSYDGGITRVKDGRLIRITMNDGLFSNGVFCFLEDNHGWIWMNSNQGIFRVRRQELNDFADGKVKTVTSIAYGRQDGLFSVEGNGGRQPAGIKARDGKLWFPMAQGLAMVDPEAVITNPLPPPVLIESVAIDRHPVANDLFQAAIHDPNQTIVMAPGQVNLEIQYTGLSLIASNEVKFKYKLEGLDPDWTDAGRRRTAYFSFIPPGTYTFRVIAANRDGVWNETGAVIKIVVKPHFYRTWWFFTLLALGIVGIAAAVYRYRVTQLKREREQQFAFTRQLIAKQEDERKRIAGELHDSLGQRLIIIKNLALMHLAAGTKQDGDIKDLSDETSAAIAEVKEISYNLRPYQLDRIGMTKAIEGLVTKVSAASTIEFFTDIAPIDDFFDSEAEINFYRIVQESLNNMVKYSAASRASVTVERDGDRLELTVRDNGKGFDAAALMKADSKARGFGLIGIVERSQFLGSNPVIQSSPGQGTLIKLIVNRKSAIGASKAEEAK
jgi:signal transduction histidine kinase/ligand-binding sensor domain-containing protein